MINYILQVMGLAQRLSLSYGQLLTTISSMISCGATVMKETLEVLKTERYKPAFKHFQKGILLLYAAAAEFKIGYRQVKETARSNPNDFKSFEEFFQQISKDFPGIVEDHFKDPKEFLKTFKDYPGVDTPNIHEFIRNSGEYMDYINSDKVEVTENQFKDIFFNRYSGRPISMRNALKYIKDSFDQRGWATLPGEEGDPEFVCWIDKFDIKLPHEVASALHCSRTYPFAEIPSIKSAIIKPWPFPINTSKVPNTRGHHRLDSGDDLMKYLPEKDES